VQAQPPVGIIGAGPAGVATAAALQAQGVPFELVDEGPDFGGIWNVERDRTPMYRSAYFLSSRTLSGFAGHSMPDDYPDYPRHDLVLRYVQEYAAQYALRAQARFGVRVVEARKVEDSGVWRATLSDGTSREYRALCVATGMAWHPRVPEYPGTFSGEHYHAFHYAGPEQFRGRRVLVVGGGNSGCDLACDAARMAERALISLRRGYHFVPKYIFGQPADVFARRGPRLPGWLERRVFTFLLDHVLVGDLTRFGLPRPDHPVLESHPVMNTRILGHLGHGDLEVRPDISHLDGDRVVFTDGREDEVDVIVWATGYRRVYPFLAEPVVDAAGEVPDLYLNVFHRDHPDLTFLGLFETDAAAFGLIGLQARLVAGYLAARGAAGATPDDGSGALARFDRRRLSERPDLTGRRRYLNTPRHAYYVHHDTYRRVLEGALREAGW
jgi:cation diffusion facilitator CzcD-associated flavoprotein CzcO